MALCRTIRAAGLAVVDPWAVLSIILHATSVMMQKLDVKSQGSGWQGGTCQKILWLQAGTCQKVARAKRFCGYKLARVKRWHVPKGSVVTSWHVSKGSVVTSWHVSKGGTCQKVLWLQAGTCQKVLWLASWHVLSVANWLLSDFHHYDTWASFMYECHSCTNATHALMRSRGK
jgi:hypothetical protein